MRTKLYTLLSPTPLLIAILFFFMFLVSGCREEFVQGRRLYEAKCAGCHMHDGTGLNGITPPLVGTERSYLDELPCIIQFGMFDTLQINGSTYTDFMLGFPELTSVEISNISNYIAFRLLNVKQPKYSPVSVQLRLDSCMKWRKPPPVDPKKDTIRMFQSI